MANQKTNKDDAQVDAKAGGAAAGGVTGAAIGAAVGGPVGAGIGAVAGAAAGGLAGSTADYTEAEPEFRKHYESSGYSDRYSWDEAAPAYRYGYEGYDATSAHGKSFADVSTHLKKSWTGKGKYEDYEPMIRSAWERRAQASLNAGDKAVIPVVEEELKVGKRKVETGGVRVETTVTETPVEEQVHLHEETVKVQRRPVDRAATDADVAFKEGTLELHESAEEAVVSKRARVVEEVVIGKESHDRTETVRDTVRKTDVDVTKTGGETKVSQTDWNTYDTGFRTHHQSAFANSGYTYEELSPAYRFGHDLAGHEKYKTGSWTTIEPEARRMWEEKNKGTWEQFKDAVHHAWQEVSGQR